MQLKMTNLKSIINSAALLVLVLAATAVQAQEVIVTDSTAIGIDSEIEARTKGNSGRYKVDGVAAVVGDYVVLESDIH